jgi:hypothetical protein
MNEEIQIDLQAYEQIHQMRREEISKKVEQALPDPILSIELSEVRITMHPSILP